MAREAVTRRNFLKAAAAAGAALGPFAVVGTTAKGAGKRFKVGLIGCGGRGNGALAQHVAAGKTLGLDIQVVATADWFQDRAERTGKKYGVPAARCFGGAKGYQKLVGTDAEIVLMATAPLFRPVHLAACVAAGKHVFIEKPVAVDPPGCRKVVAAGEQARAKGLTVVAGTNMHHEKRFLDTHQAVAVEGALGKLHGGRIGCCLGHHFHKQPIRPKTADDLVRSWQNWLTLSGDHIVEQHVHQLDIANWFAGRPPVGAVGFGGRARRPAGALFDFFSIDFDYGDSVHIHSVCRQVAGCWVWAGHDLVYAQGHTSGGDRPEPKQSPVPADLPQVRGGHSQEHVNLLYYLTRGKPLNQAKAVAEATAATILGRTAAYTGAQVLWRDMMDDPKKRPELYSMTLEPTAEDFEAGRVAIPKEGAVPVPGKSASASRPRRKKKK